MGADIAKLAANRVELFWSDKHLYAALNKHIANRSSELLRYCELAGIDFDSFPKLYAIVRARGQEKFDVPDLFLHGLNLRRKGGVRRR